MFFSTSSVAVNSDHIIPMYKAYKYTRGRLVRFKDNETLNHNPNSSKERFFFSETYVLHKHTFSQHPHSSHIWNILDNNYPTTVFTNLVPSWQIIPIFLFFTFFGLRDEIISRDLAIKIEPDYLAASSIMAVTFTQFLSQKFSWSAAIFLQVAPAFLLATSWN